MPGEPSGKYLTNHGQQSNLEAMARLMRGSGTRRVRQEGCFAGQPQLLKVDLEGNLTCVLTGARTQDQGFTTKSTSPGW